MSNKVKDINTELLHKMIRNLQHDHSVLAHRFDQLYRMVQHAVGTCPTCNGHGRTYTGSEGRSIPDPCERCQGSGKVNLDFDDMMMKFKEEARKQVKDELTDYVPF